MKRLLLAVVAVLSFAGLACGQSAPVKNIYAVGVSYNQSATPSVAGSALYARSVDSVGTYAFTSVDLLPTSSKPFTVTTNVSAGVAQKAFSIGKIPIYVPATAGLSFSGSNSGWAYSTGALASIKLGKSNFRLFPSIRVLRSNVSNGSGLQPVVGLSFGWGQ